MLFKRHLWSSATMTGRRCNRETATNKNASIRQSCSGLMSALCVPFRVFLVQALQCSCVNSKADLGSASHVQCKATSTKGCWCGDTDSSSVTLHAGAEFCTWVLPTHPKCLWQRCPKQATTLWRIIPCAPQKSSAIMESTGTNTGHRAPERGWLCNWV